MAGITVVISAWNEEVKLGKCLSSVSWADEIIVIDSQSTDKTAKIAKDRGAKVFTRPNNPMLNINKNYGFEKASNEWILSLDADEEVTSELVNEIRSVLDRNSDIVGYWIPRKNISFGKWIAHGLWWPDKQLRLFKKGSGEFPCKHVHEYVLIEGRTDELTEPFVHYNYDTISQFIRKMDTLYTENEVQKLIDTQHKVVWFDAIRFPVSDFVKIFFAQGGYKDGLHGLVLAMLQAFYSLVVFAKLWERNKFETVEISLPEISKQLTWAKREVQYWQITENGKNIHNPWKKIINKIKLWYATRF